MKCRTRSRKRRCSNTPSSTTCSSGSVRRRIVSPAIVRQGLNHSRPRRERADARLHAVGDDQHRVGGEERRDLAPCRSGAAGRRVQIVAFSSAAFFSSITASGRPLTKSTTSGRRVCLFSTTVNWLTASQSLLSGSSKSSTRACAPPIEPSGVRYSTVTPSTSRRCTARLRADSVGALGPRELAEGVVERLGGQPRVEPRRAPRAAAAPGRRRRSRCARRRARRARSRGRAGPTSRGSRARRGRPVQQ